MVDHVDHLALAVCKQLCDRAQVLFVDVDRKPFHRLVEFAVDHLRNHFWLADRKLESLAAHRFHKHRELEFAATLEDPCVGPVGRQNSDRDVADQLSVESVLEHACRQLLAVETG